MAHAPRTSRETTQMTPSRLCAPGEAAGVTPLRKPGSAARTPAGGSQDLSPRGRAAFAAVLVALALLVGVGGYAGIRAALSGLERVGATGEATSAVNAYVAFAVRADDGSLARAWLCYADSINDRAEMASLPANARAAQEGTSAPETLAHAYERAGLDGLCAALASASQVTLAGAVELSADEMAQLLALARGEQGAPTPAQLAAQLADDEGSTLSETALRGLLNTLRDVGAEGFVELSAPTDAREDDGEAVEVLRSSEWLTTVRGMRDTGQVASEALDADAS